MHRILLLASLFVLAACPAGAQVLNGSFEPAADDTARFDHRSVHAGGIPGWEATGAGVEWIATGAYGFDAPNGACAVDLATGGRRPGGIAQEVPTVPGTTYRVVFWLGSQRAAGADGTARIEATAGGARAAFTVRNRERDVLWQAQGFEFTARAERTTLEFRCSQGARRHFAYLDGVGLKPVAVQPAARRTTIPAVLLAAR